MIILIARKGFRETHQRERKDQVNNCKLHDSNATYN